MFYNKHLELSCINCEHLNFIGPGQHTSLSEHVIIQFWVETTEVEFWLLLYGESENVWKFALNSLWYLSKEVIQEADVKNNQYFYHLITTLLNRKLHIAYEYLFW